MTSMAVAHAQLISVLFRFVRDKVLWTWLEPRLIEWWQVGEKSHVMVWQDVKPK